MAQTKAATRQKKGKVGPALNTVERLKAVADPTRIRLILELLDRESTVKELAEALGVPATRLYYHVKILERHGLIEVAHRRMVSGIEERTYHAPSEDWTVPPDMKLSALYESGALRAMFDVVRSEVEVAVQSRPDLPMDAPGSPIAGIGLTEIEVSEDELRELTAGPAKVLTQYAMRKREAPSGARYPPLSSPYPSPPAPS